MREGAALWNDYIQDIDIWSLAMYGGEVMCGRWCVEEVKCGRRSVEEVMCLGGVQKVIHWAALDA